MIYDILVREQGSGFFFFFYFYLPIATRDVASDEIKTKLNYQL